MAAPLWILKARLEPKVPGLEQLHLPRGLVLEELHRSPVLALKELLLSLALALEELHQGTLALALGELLQSPVQSLEELHRGILDAHSCRPFRRKAEPSCCCA